MTPKICDRAADAFVTMLNFITNWFPSSKMFENRDNIYSRKILLILMTEALILLHPLVIVNIKHNKIILTLIIRTLITMIEKLLFMLELWICIINKTSINQSISKAWHQTKVWGWRITKSRKLWNDKSNA